MATYPYTTSQCSSSSSSHRPMAMVLAFVSALILSPLYTNYGGGVSRRSGGILMNHDSITWIGSGLVVPMVLAGLIIAIRTTSKGSSRMPLPSSDPSWVLRIGSSSWGLTGVLVMLILVISWQHSFQEFIWK